MSLARRTHDGIDDHISPFEIPMASSEATACTRMNQFWRDDFFVLSRNSASEFAAGFAAGRMDEVFAAVVARGAFFLDADGSTGAPVEAASTEAALPSAGAVAFTSDTGALFAGIPAEVTGASLAALLLCRTLQISWTLLPPTSRTANS